MGLLSDLGIPGAGDTGLGNGFAGFHDRLTAGDPLGRGIVEGIFGNNDPLGLLPAEEDPNAHQASNTMAGLYREQWADYLKRFAPLETDLRDQVMSGARMDNALSRADQAVTTQFGVAKGNLARQREGLGLSPTMSAAEQRRFDIGQGLARANTLNTTRQAVEDSNMQIIAGVGGRAS